MDRDVDTVAVLRQVMEDEGFRTQRELAEAIGMSANQVNRWLTGAANLTERRLVNVLHTLGINPVRYGLRPSRARLQSVPQPGATTGMPSETEAALREEIRLLRAEIQQMSYSLAKVARTLRDIRGSEAE
jgi:transcriptional regulator with XRE-family HTH domain